MQIVSVFIHRTGRNPLTTDPHAQLHRRDAIVRILRQTAVGRQAELVERLREEGFDATQSSVSRDLRELGVLKGADGYLLKEDRFEVLVEELQKIVRGQPPLSPAIARRLLTHFRFGGLGDSGASDSGFNSASAFQTSRPVPTQLKARPCLRR